MADLRFRITTKTDEYLTFDEDDLAALAEALGIDDLEERVESLESRAPGGRAQADAQQDLRRRERRKRERRAGGSSTETPPDLPTR